MKRTKLIFCVGLTGIFALHSAGLSTGADTTPNSKKGVESTVSQAYFKMGDMRLLNNDWGSKSLNCNSSYKIFIQNDGSFGWEFNRGSCGGGDNPPPDYPEVEFGIHPFGTAKNMVTSPDFCSTTLLPLQIKNITSASVTIDQMNIQMPNPTSWNINFEMWLTNQHPVTGSHNCAVAEIMTFWGWQDGRWPCDQNGSLTSGTSGYAYCHYGSQWGCGWDYHQFRVNGGPMKTYSGKLDVRAILDWFVANKGVSKDLWVSRFEIGSEIGDNTSGKVTIKKLTFEVNGVLKFPEFYDPTVIREKSSDRIVQNWKSAVFPARTWVDIVNLQGERIRRRTGTHSESAVELSKNLPRGIYMLYGMDSNGRMSKKAVVVPVL
jgi:hypothetical protein